jgi:hypothetical protein
MKPQMQTKNFLTILELPEVCAVTYIAQGDYYRYKNAFYKQSLMLGESLKLIPY